MVFDELDPAGLAMPAVLMSHHQYVKAMHGTLSFGRTHAGVSCCPNSRDVFFMPLYCRIQCTLLQEIFETTILRTTPFRDLNKPD